jgi:hypothetical protein
MGNKSKDEWYDNKIRYFYDGKETKTREMRGEKQIKLGQNRHIGRKR